MSRWGLASLLPLTHLQGGYIIYWKIQNTTEGIKAQAIVLYYSALLGRYPSDTLIVKPRL